MPIRYKRMSASPFAFYRGAASIMASDLQTSACTGIHTQICGDAHLSNFGYYASPERRIVFDVNDFDETIEGCWEWDLKRLCASIAVLGAHRTFRRRTTDSAIRACARTYRECMHDFAGRLVLDMWYAQIDRGAVASDAGRAAQHLYAKTVDDASGLPRIVDRPPLVFHPSDEVAFTALVRDAIARYARTLEGDRRELLRRFTFADAAYKVVGVGSVGTRCAVVLLLAGADDPLFLQMKEARASVYARYGARNPYKDEGERVVAGQRLMQAVSDVFLGWARAKDGHMFYVRQLRDAKSAVDLETIEEDALAEYAQLCARALARAHAKASGAADEIAAYVGTGDALDDAMAVFAHAYAKQNAEDYGTLLAAIADGRIETQT